MNLIVWLVIGGVVGWLASIIMKRDAQQGIFLNIVVGVIGALLAGWFISPLVGLGTINSVRLSVSALADFPVVVALNRYGDEPLHARNLEHLTAVDELDVVLTPRALADRVRGR